MTSNGGHKFVGIGRPGRIRWPVAGHRSPVTGHRSPVAVTGRRSPVTGAGPRSCIPYELTTGGNLHGVCARYSTASPFREVVNRFGVVVDPDFDLPPRYNRAPGQDAPVIVARRGVMSRNVS